MRKSLIYIIRIWNDLHRTMMKYTDTLCQNFETMFFFFNFAINVLYKYLSLKSGLFCQYKRLISESVKLQIHEIYQGLDNCILIIFSRVNIFAILVFSMNTQKFILRYFEFAFGLVNEHQNRRGHGSE